MLVLTRRVGEEIVIGDMVRVTIDAVHNQRVKLGITAPSQVTVHREEVHQRLFGVDCPGNAEQNENAVMDGIAKWLRGVSSRDGIAWSGCVLGRQLSRRKSSLNFLRCSRIRRFSIRPDPGRPNVRRRP